MNISDLPSRLRELADKFEAAELPDCKVQLEISSYKAATTRDELAKWLLLMGGTPEILQGTGGESYLRSGGIMSDVLITKWFKQGLIGGERIEVIKDDPAGFAALLAEVESRETAGAGV